MIGVHFRHKQRNVRFHPMVAGIRNDQMSGFGERALNVGGDRGIHRREDELRRARHRLTFFDLHGGNRFRHLACEAPLSGVAVELARGTVAGAEECDVEPGMTLQETDEALPHHPGGSEDPDWYA